MAQQLVEKRLQLPGANSFCQATQYANQGLHSTTNTARLVGSLLPPWQYRLLPSHGSMLPRTPHKQHAHPTPQQPTGPQTRRKPHYHHHSVVS
jgi:hypothetical protein